MKDFVGNELKVGDTVAFSDTTTRNQRSALLCGEVTGFSEKKIKLWYMDNDLHKRRAVTRFPSGVAKCNNPNLSVDDKIEQDKAKFRAVVEAYLFNAPRN